MSALALEGVTVRLGARSVLAGVDLMLDPGEVLVLAGRNGAGKTTLLRVAGGLRRPDAGTVAVLGKPLTSLSAQALARAVAWVPQETSVAFPFRAGEVVLMGRAPHLRGLGFESERDVEIALDALARVGQRELAERSILELSGGERQLVMVARALAQQTPILLLDEPAAHLDLAHRLELLALLREVAASGVAVLLVSHDLDLAARAGDRIALLADGRIAACGPPAEVLEPARLRAVFGVEAEVLAGPNGPVVVPTAPSPEDDS